MEEHDGHCRATWSGKGGSRFIPVMTSCEEEGKMLELRVPLHSDSAQEPNPKQ